MRQGFGTRAAYTALGIERKIACARLHSTLRTRSLLLFVVTGGYLFILLLCLEFSGCHSSTTVHIAPGCSTCNGGIVITDTSIDFVSKCPFQPYNQVCDQTNPPCAGQPACPSAFHQSKMLWLLSGEQLAVRWGGLMLHVLNPGQNGAACDVDFCSPAQMNHPPASCDRLALDIRDSPVTVLACEGFELCDRPGVINAPSSGTSRSGNSCYGNDGCRYGGTSPTGVSPPTFTPTKSTTYQVVYSGAMTSPPPILAEKKVVVIQNGMPLTTLYKSELYTETANPSYAWYKWETKGDPIWDDNFSPSLRVTRVRILKGQPAIDPTTGGFSLDPSTIAVVRPSRLVLAPAFVPSREVFRQGRLRCYADTSKDDGDFDLTRCRSAFGNNTSELLDTTPTYLKDHLTDRLTWLAEFNPCEGCGAACSLPCSTGAQPPVLGPGEVLAIEFTIQAV